MTRGRLMAGACVLVGAAGLVAGLWLLLREPLPEGPVSVAWDRETCAHCRMHVGQPAFAAQLQTREGRVMNFDDAGCFFRFEQANAPAVHAVYFHHHRDARWLSRDAVAFRGAGPSPMGFDLAAVDPGPPGLLSYDDARKRALQGNAKESRK